MTLSKVEWKDEDRYGVPVDKSCVVGLIQNFYIRVSTVTRRVLGGHPGVESDLRFQACHRMFGDKGETE